MLRIVGYVVAGVFVLMLAGFYALTVQIEDGTLRFSMGLIGPRQSIPLESIRDPQVVQNPWYYFWGIKAIPGGIFYALGPGGHGIEFTVGEGKKIRLGICQDNAEKLKQHLEDLKA